jgi:RecB family exonuclease
LAIGMGRDRYLRSVDQKIASLETAAPSVTGDDDNDRDRNSNREIRLQGLRVVRKLVQDLLDGVPAVDSSQSNVLKAADRFLETQARALTRLDNFALEKLREEIREMERWIEKDEEPVSLNIWDWLEALPRKARALAGNPEPGKLHVAPILAGGHTARKHTFLVGLDDGRFPGAGLQDPILLDKERKLLSSNLRLASRQLRDKLDSFARLMARLRGSVTLCFSCHHLLEDREMFPSPVLLAAFRILSGNHDADQSDIRALAPVSFAPTDLAGCLDDGEWWLWQAEAEPVREPMTLVGTLYPHLGRGLDAAKARAGPAFTSYDGSVALAGRDRDPTAPDGPVMTASALQTIGRCPLAYFFQYVLGVRLPEEVGADPQHWLDPLVLGSLLHSVFEEFVRGLLREERLPEFERDYADLLGILDAEIEKYKVRYPIPSTGVFCKQYRQLRDTARIFLIEEEDYYRATGARPAFLEATIGYAHGPEATPLDTKDPVTLTLPGGKQFRACGRIDRIDLLGDAKGPAYAVWDYKTGGHKYYKKGDPFQQGRMIQNAFYQALAAERLQTISPGARLAYFGYFFPGVSSRGERITWTPAETAEGPAVMKNLLAIVANGAFAPTTDHGADCTFCAHRTACGDVALTAEGSKLKLEDPANTALQPFGELRAHGGG